MASKTRNLNLELDQEIANKLSRLAELSHMDDKPFAEKLLTNAVDGLQPGGESVTRVLDGIPGAWERTQRGLQAAENGDTIPLNDF